MSRFRASELVQATMGQARDLSEDPRIARVLLEDLERAERDLGRRLRELRRTGLGQRFSGGQAELVRAQVRIATSEVVERVHGQQRASARRAAVRGVRETEKLARGLERRFTGIAQPLRLTEAARLIPIVDQATGARARYIATSLDRYGATMIGELEQIIRGGLISGATTDDMIAALTGHGGPRGTVSMAARVTPAGVIRLVESDIPEGLFVRHRYWAERLIRTEVMAAYNGAKLESLRAARQDFPDMQKKILAVLDNRTAEDSIYVHGQIRDLEENFVDGAGREYLYPPARPNDRETVVPWRRAWDEGPDEDLGELDEIERALLDPESLTAEERAALLERAGLDAPTSRATELSAGALPSPPPPPLRGRP